MSKQQTISSMLSKKGIAQLKMLHTLLNNLLGNLSSILIIMGIMLAIQLLIGLPIKILLRLGMNTFFGFILLSVFNSLGSLLGLHIPINLRTNLIAGTAGVPGVLAIILHQFMSIKF